jgi:hypothetical protein
MYDAAGGATAAAMAQAAEPLPVPTEHATADHAVADPGRTEQPADKTLPGQQPGAEKSDPPAADVGPFGSKAEAQLAAAAADSAVAEPISELIFVDGRLPDIGSLTARPGAEIIILDPSRDGI